MKKLTVCSLLILVCYGFTYSGNEKNALLKSCVMAKETSSADKGLGVAETPDDPPFHPLLFLTTSIK